jgi:hypothetical protein
VKASSHLAATCERRASVVMLRRGHVFCVPLINKSASLSCQVQHDAGTETRCIGTIVYDTCSGTGLATASRRGSALTVLPIRGSANFPAGAGQNELIPPHPENELALPSGFDTLEGNRGDSGCNESCRSPESIGFKLAARTSAGSFVSPSAARVGSTGVVGLETLGLELPISSFREAELAAALRVQRPTPSMAFKKCVEPTLSDRVIASRVGANCCSSFNSCIPSCIRSPRSATTDGFSLQGCLG